MQTQKADISVVYDDKQASRAVLSALSSYFTVRVVPLEKYVTGVLPGATLTIFSANMGVKETSDQIKKALKICRGETLFILPTHNSDSISKLRQLSKADYFLLPLDGETLRKAIKSALNRPVEKAWAALDPAKLIALKSAVVFFEKCFDQVANGDPIPLEDITSSCQHIRSAAELGGLDSWINALDDHHDYSFRHSMFVCGSLSYFAHAMGIRGAELDQLTLGGLLHDIGKCRIPLEILDKPGKLDGREWDVIKLHPVHSRDILTRENDIGADITAMAVYHHEKLDGTGYPDGLSGAQINDHIRLTAVADVYSALIDKRAYKGSMSSEAALDIMATLKDELDMDVVREFRSFTLDKG
ncbi:MAG: HD-GYP domain-containing protein (c-di-GMP phosphodiesterase class II) [Alphaproteobacteria bacterium]|jgi:HD-GYP domain-containing protein (c-di-GMP phosphodiesterase class II)